MFVKIHLSTSGLIYPSICPSVHVNPHEVYGGQAEYLLDMHQALGWTPAPHKLDEVVHAAT